jgi:Icc-related predicted phosphoesterase
MRLVILSDTHRNHRDIKLPEGDVLIHCGDYCLGLEKHQTAATVYDFCDWMNEQNFKCKIVVSGNHDSIENRKILLKQFSVCGLVHLVDQYHEYNKIKFFGSPWITPVYGAFNADEEDIRKYTEKCNNCDVLITHSPPAGILSNSRNDDETGSIAIRELSQRVKPKIHCFGHCHNNGGRSITMDNTTYINAAMVDKNYQLINSPIVIDI